MAQINVAINGFGRIGRLTLRALLSRAGKHVNVVAINDLSDPKMLAHLFKYDTAQGKFPGKVSVSKGNLKVGTEVFKVFSERDPEKLPWKDLKVDVVIECTGIFRTKEAASKHLTAGAKKVVISAPAKSPDVKTIVMGINHKSLKKSDHIVSNASCTTNCLSPMVKVLEENFGISTGLFTTVHAYTSDQRIQDAPHSDMRRARAAAQSIIPTSTGAASAVMKVIPSVKGKLTGIAARVPVITGSLTDLNVTLKKKATAEEINAAFKAASKKSLKGVMEYTEEPLVSTDIIGNEHSCIFDSGMTVSLGKAVKIVGWYDNEYGFASRLADLVVLIKGMIKK